MKVGWVSVDAIAANSCRLDAQAYLGKRDSYAINFARGKLTYLVETVRPPLPNHGSMFRVHRWVVDPDLNDFDVDCLSPNMTSVWKVEEVHTKKEAVAVLIETLAGKDTRAKRYM